MRVRVNRSEGNLYLHFTQKIDDIVHDNVPSPPDTPTNMKSHSSDSLLKASTRSSMTVDLNKIDATLRHTMGDLKNLVSPMTRSDDGPVYHVHPREDEVDSVFAWLHDNAYRVSLSKCRLDFNEVDVISFKDRTHGDVTLRVSCGNLDNRQQYIMVSFDGVDKPVRVLRHDGDRRIHLDLYGFGKDENLRVPLTDKYVVFENLNDRVNCITHYYLCITLIFSVTRKISRTEYSNTNARTQVQSSRIRAELLVSFSHSCEQRVRSWNRSHHNCTGGSK